VKYICLRYVLEERILNDVLDVFKDAQYFDRDMKLKITQQVYFKVVLDACELKASEYQKFQKMEEADRFKLMNKKSFSKMLLSIDSGRLMLFTLKKKDEIDL
jgi:hypothetical protein